MSERLRGVLAFTGASLIVTCVAIYEWAAAIGVAGVLALAAALRKPK